MQTFLRDLNKNAVCMKPEFYHRISTQLKNEMTHTRK